MWGNNDRVTCLKSNQGFKNSGGCGVGRGDNCCNQTDRLSDLLDPVLLIFLDHTNCLGILISVVNVLCRVVVLNNLVFHNAHASLCNCHLGQRKTHLVCRACCCKEDLIYLLLCISRKNFLRFTHSVHFCVQSVHAVDDFRNNLIDFFCHFLFLHFSLCLWYT